MSKRTREIRIEKVIVLDMVKQLFLKSENRSGMILHRNLHILTIICMKVKVLSVTILFVVNNRLTSACSLTEKLVAWPVCKVDENGYVRKQKCVHE